MQVKTDVQDLKKIAPSAAPAEETKWTHTPTWVPVQTDGKAVMTVTTRQGYLDGELRNWRTIQLTRVGGIVLGVGALYFLTVNILIAAALALGAGWAWGIYSRQSFLFYEINRTREIMEGT